MLLLAQHEREIIVLETSDGPIEVRLTRFGGEQARIGIDAPKSVRIIRKTSHEQAAPDLDAPDAAEVAPPPPAETAGPLPRAAVGAPPSATSPAPSPAIPPRPDVVAVPLSGEAQDEGWWYHPDDLADGTDAGELVVDGTLTDWDDGSLD